MHGRTDSSMAKAMVGAVGGGILMLESIAGWEPHDCHCLAPSALCDSVDKRAIVLPSKGMSHHSAWLGVPPERAGVGK